MNGPTPPARPSAFARRFAAGADRVSHVIGQPHTFIALCAVVAIWAGAVYFLRVPNGWEPIANTIGIVTFLMVFLIQSTQNRNGAAVQAKLDELIRALEPAENKFRGIEKLTVEEVHEIRGESEEEVRVLEEKIERAAARKRSARERTP